MFPGREFSLTRFFMISFGLVVVSYTTSVLFGNIALVISITGATACTFVAYLLPILYSYNLKLTGHWSNALGAFSVVMGIVSLYQIGMEM
jgi:amino acid permease